MNSPSSDEFVPQRFATGYGPIFTGRVAVVTGAANGIGRSAALGFARGGGSVVLGDIDEAGLRNAVGEIKALGGKAIAVVGDVTEEEPAADLIGKAIDAFGTIDILVNNVGGSIRGGRVWELSLETWQTVIKRNLQSCFLCTRAVVPHMIEKRYGRIVGLSSGSAKGSPWRVERGGGVDYATSKAGVEGFVRHLSLELAEYNVTVNAVSPGPIETERLRESFKQLEKLEYSPKRMTPLRRLGQPSEVAAAILFLASAEASYITGQTLSVAGGR